MRSAVQGGQYKVERTDKRTDDQRTDERTDERTEEQTDQRTNGPTKERTDKRTETPKSVGKRELCSQYPVRARASGGAVYPLFSFNFYMSHVELTIQV